MTPAPRLADVHAAVRDLLARRARGAAAAWAGVAVVAILILAWLLAGNDGWIDGTATPLALDLLLVALLGSGAWAFRRHLARWLHESRVTRSMEEAAGLPRGLVLGSLEISRDLPPGVSPALAARAEGFVIQDLALPTEALAGRLHDQSSAWARRARGWLVALSLAVVALAVLAPTRAAQAWKGLVTPLDLLREPVRAPLVISPGSIEVLRGSTVAVSVTAAGREAVTLRWQADGDVERTETSPVVEGEARFSLRDVRAPVAYRATAADGSESEVHVLIPVDPLFVSDVTVALDFPSYTGRATEEYRGNAPPLVVPVGTRVRVEGQASRALSEAGLTLPDGGAALALEVAGPLFSGSFLPAESGSYAWRFLDEAGAAAELVPEPLTLTLVPDSAPSVRITFPAADTVLPMNLRQPLVIEALDDHGLRSLELVAYRVTSLGDRQEPVVQRTDLGGSRGVLARPLMDVSSWGLLPGDTVRYFARVADNSPAATAATTPEYVLRMPGATEMRRAAEQRLEEVARRLEELTERAGETADETRDLERRSAAGAEDPPPRGGRGRQDAASERMDFQEHEDVRQALDRQAGMNASVDSLQAGLQELAEAMREAGASDPELARDLAELQELLDQIASEETRERMEELARDLDHMDATQSMESLRDLSDEQDQFRERLEASLERFRRAAVEQDFRATTAEADELARRERALADALREEDSPEARAGQQDEIQSRTEEMEERMRRLEERLQQLGEQEAAREVQSAREESVEAQAAMARAGQEARQRQGQEAGERAEEAAQGLERAAEDLREAQDQMAQAQAEAMRQALQRAADDALTLARRQSQLREEMGEAGADRLAELRGDEAALAQGVRNMAEEVAGAIQASGEGGRELSQRMGEAMEALERTVRALEGRAASASTPTAAAERAVEALNQVAVIAMAGAQNMARGGEGQSTGQEQMQEQLESLAQRQGQVNNQASQLMPMQLGQQAMEAQMRQLSQGQRSVASDLGELADRPGNEGQTLGDLEAMAEEARRLAEELADGRMDADTRERQERLFHRLLDAGRSLENEDLSDEREARVPGAFERGPIAPLGPETLNALPFRLPSAEALRSLTPAERALVLQYFERLNRGRAPGSGGGP